MIARCFGAQYPAGGIHKKTTPFARSHGRRLPAAALPRAPSQIRHPRLGAADGPRARDQGTAENGVLAQRRDHRRLGRQLGSLQPAVAVAEARADGGDADEIPEINWRHTAVSTSSGRSRMLASSHTDGSATLKAANSVHKQGCMAPCIPVAAMRGLF
jgi:hypothetical protein